MRILFVNPPGLPSRQSGTTLRSAALMEALRCRHVVDHLILSTAQHFTYSEEPNPVGARHVATVSKKRTLIIPTADRRSLARLDEHVGLDQYDLIVGHFISSIGLLRHWQRTPKIVDADTLTYSYGSDGRPDQQLTAGAKSIYRNMITRAAVLGGVDHCWILCEEDMDRLPPERATYLPHFVRDRSAEFALETTDAGQPIVLFVGTLWYPPNSQGIKRFISNAWPQVLGRLPNAQLRVIGDGSPALRASIHGPNVSVPGYAEDLAAEYRRSTVVIAPIVAGGGWQTKITEAFEHAKPVVATAFSCRGFKSFAKKQPGLVECDSVAAMAQPVIDLLVDPQNSSNLGQAVRLASLAEFPISRFQSTILETVQRYT